MLSKLSFLITRLRNSTKRICLGILPLIFSFIDLGAQNVSSNGVDLPNVIAPSPVAQTFMRYGEIPVDYSTGVPNIEIYRRGEKVKSAYLDLVSCLGHKSE